MGAIKLNSKNKANFSVKMGISPISQGNTYGLGMILFGLVFVATSILMTLTFVDFKLEFFENLTWEKLDQIPAKSKVSYKILFMISGMFFLAGLKVSISGIQNYLKNAERKRQQKLYPSQPWKYDHPWSSQWAHARTSKTSLFTHFVGLSIVAGFHVVLFKIVPLEFPGLFIYIGMALFDILIVFGFYISSKRSQRAEPVKVSLPSFPLNLGNSFNLQLSGLSNYKINEIEVTLTCCQEVYSYKKKNNSQGVKLKTLHEIKDTVSAQGGSAQFNIELPSNSEFSSEVGAHPARFWNLHLYASCEGPDLDKHFLLPIY